MRSSWKLRTASGTRKKLRWPGSSGRATATAGSTSPRGSQRTAAKAMASSPSHKGQTQHLGRFRTKSQQLPYQISARLLALLRPQTCWSSCLSFVKTMRPYFWSFSLRRFRVQGIHLRAAMSTHAPYSRSSSFKHFKHKLCFCSFKSKVSECGAAGAQGNCRLITGVGISMEVFQIYTRQLYSAIWVVVKIMVLFGSLL